MYEVIWHGRGGQGVVVAAQILAESAYFHGFKGVTSAPTFGPERRGAPLTASTRFSSNTIRMVSQVEHADIAVVLDSSLLATVNVLGALKEGGLIIVNTEMKPDDLRIEAKVRVATIDAGAVAIRHRLVREGNPVVNTPMLGAFSKASDLVPLESMIMGLKEKLSSTVAAPNIAALRDAYEQTHMNTSM